SRAAGAGGSLRSGEPAALCARARAEPGFRCLHRQRRVDGGRRGLRVAASAGAAQCGPAAGAQPPDGLRRKTAALALGPVDAISLAAIETALTGPARGAAAARPNRAGRRLSKVFPAAAPAGVAPAPARRKKRKSWTSERSDWS